MDADQLRASHTTGYAQRSEAEFPPEIQGRAYHGSRGRQAREHTEGIVSSFDPARALDQTISAAEGPPVVTESGVVVAGNGRTIAQQRVHESPEASAALKQQVVERASEFGLDPDQVAGIAKPVLVRRITDPGVDQTDVGTLQALNTSSDQPIGKTKDPISEGATKAASLKAARTSLEHFASTVDPEDSIRGYLGGAAGKDFLSELVQDGVITQAERARYIDVNTGVATDEGKTLVERMFYVAALGDADVVSRAPKAVLRKLDTSLPAIIRAGEAGGDWAVGPVVSEAMDVLAGAKASGMTLDDFVSQIDIEREPPNPAAVDMARFMSGKKAEVRDAFREYANRAEAFTRQSQSDDLFGYEPPTAGESESIFRQAALAPQLSAAQVQMDIFGFEIPAAAQTLALDPQQESIFGDRNPELAEGWEPLGEVNDRVAYRDPEGNTWLAPTDEVEQATGKPKGARLATGVEQPAAPASIFTPVDEDPVGSGNLFEGTHPMLPEGQHALAPMAQLSEQLPSAGIFAEGTATEAPKATAIVRDLQDVLQKELGGLKLREGGGIMKRALAVVTPRSGVVRSRSISDVSAIGHEYGHLMQKLLIGTDAKGDISDAQLAELPGAVRGELEDLAKGISDESLTEGWAEYFRRFLDNPEALEQSAPNAHEFIQGKMDEYPALKNVWQEQQEQWRLHRDASPQARLRSHVSIGESDPELMGVDDKWWRTRTNWMDDFAPIQRVMKMVRERTGTDLEIEEDAETLARLTRSGYTGRAELAVGHKTPGGRFVGGALKYGTWERVGKSLTEALDPVTDSLDDFRDYMVARRAQELHGRDIMTGIRDQDVEWTLKHLEEKHGDTFRDAFDDVLEFEDNGLQMLVDAGVISPESAAEIRKVNRSFVPFYRVHEGKAGGLGGGSGFGNLWSPVKRLKGSGRDIVDPLESIVKNTFSYMQLVGKQQVSTALANLSEREGVGDLMEQVMTPMRPQQFSVGEVSADLKKAIPGLDQLMEKLGEQGIDAKDEMLAVFRPGDYFGKPNMISVLKDGKRKWFEVDPELYKSLEGLNTEHMGMVSRFLSGFARTLRAGATLDPTFMIRNFSRDQLSAAVNSESGYRPVLDFFRGLFEAVRKGDAYEDFMASGAARSTLLGLDRDTMARKVADITQKGGIRNVLKNPLDPLRMLSELSEQGTRIGEFMRAREGGAGLEEAGRAAQEVSVNFDRHGAKTTAVRGMASFWNAGLQGYDRTVRAFKDNPVGTSARVFSGITMPSIILYALNRDDEDFWNLPQWQRDTHWHIPGRDDDGERIFYTVPKPFELGLIFGTVPERVISAMESRPGRVGRADTHLHRGDPGQRARDAADADRVRAAHGGRHELQPVPPAPDRAALAAAGTRPRAGHAPHQRDREADGALDAGPRGHQPDDDRQRVLRLDRRARAHGDSGDRQGRGRCDRRARGPDADGGRFPRHARPGRAPPGFLVRARRADVPRAERRAHREIDAGVLRADRRDREVGARGAGSGAGSVARSGADARKCGQRDRLVARAGTDDPARRAHGPGHEARAARRTRRRSDQGRAARAGQRRMTTAYDVLGVPKGASESEIRSAYRALAKEHHPDVSEHPQAEEVFKQINHAHDILTHERSGYDRWLARRRRPPALRIRGGRGPERSVLRQQHQQYHDQQQYHDELLLGAGMARRYRKARSGNLGGRAWRLNPPLSRSTATE